MSTDPLAGPIEPFPEDSLAATRDDHHDHVAHADPIHEEVETHVDPAVAEAVHQVRDRFGARGLRDLITLASYELDVAEQAFASLNAPASPDEARLDEAFAGYVQAGGDDAGPVDDGEPGPRP
ncbi:hypothetical protein [Jannaschia sp. R86511]|uniref:hypothetical protein n=1 Tax=Jannaschia sp. R86511 TaxID=3093853 RepID=UPI0036D2B786